MANQATQDQVARAARRALLIDGLPVILLGCVALALGSDPSQTDAQKTWWIGVTGLFVLAVVWVLWRAFRRGDEYLRKIQLESMAVAFAVVLAALQVAVVLDAAGAVGLHLMVEPIVIGGIVVWQVIADLRTRFNR